MIFTLTEEQDELRRTVRAFLADKSPPARVRRVMEADGFDRELWRALAGQIGLTGLGIPEEHGGAGAGWVEVAVVLEELGRSLACVPFLTSTLAAAALLAAGDDGAAKDLLPALAGGEVVGTLAVAEDAGRWSREDVAAAARREGGEWRLHGHKSFVLDGHAAGLVVVAARAPGGLSLFAVEAGAPGLTVTPLPTMDLSRRLARLELAGVPARLVGEEGAAEAVVAGVVDAGCMALAAEQVGGAQRVLEMAVDYARTRVQFGRPIGSFQAVKHRCADMLVAVESARSAAGYAAWCAATGSDDLPVAASVAKACCSDAYVQCAADNVQIHGGIGFTWEHDAHLYLKRAKSSQLLFGDPAAHRARLARLVGLA